MASPPVLHHSCCRQTHGCFRACDDVGAWMCLCCLHTQACCFSMPCPLAGRGPFPEPRWALSTRGRWVGALSAAGPGTELSFLGGNGGKESGSVGKWFLPVDGALLAGHRAEPSWKICCNHYLCSFFIMHFNETQMHPTHCKYGPFKLKCYWRCFNSATP